MANWSVINSQFEGIKKTRWNLMVAQDKPVLALLLDYFFITYDIDTTRCLFDRRNPATIERID